ncbi:MULTISPECIES: C-type lectin domain-containing protein [Maribacter]|uniref:C-type lectin domain-containing protein n=1 Tax=Maribacter flavus TaxID=1658664 RepID=A0ABU7IJG1_9FLAO|nr:MULTISPECIES: C-type lectin domain-containing protein [Maribacter]MDC6406125.1 C-type lectin domain-containing protein [Maribacter sp. PR66]MEE1973090.1 C-type lectin domain-containing protein [Maribacter flavus]
MKYLIVLLVFTVIGIHSMYGQETYLDTFSAFSYSGNEGSMSFAGGWSETGEANDPGSGRIQIDGQRLRFQNLDNNYITRNLNLANALTATLTFDFQRTNGDEIVTVQLYDGSTYSTVGNLDGSGSFNYSLNANQMNANAGIRFISGSGNWSNSETLYVDNVLFTVVFPDDPPVLIATGNQIHCNGGNTPIAQTISITDPDDTSTTAVYMQISNGYIAGEDLLTLTGSHPGITSTWDAVEGKLTLQGPATYSAFENAILDVHYSTSSPNPTGSRQFSITVGEANFLPATGHYYEYVADVGISWTDAEVAASNRTYFGLQGYLATLTTQEEADFSGSQAQGVGWIGASDAATEGEWFWVTGPEAGTPFWSGRADGSTLPPTNFANWNGGEPNQSGNEDYAHITDPSVVRGGAPLGSWNDLPNGGGSGAYAPQGYVVEYGGMPGDPVLNISATTSLTMDDTAPTWVSASGSLDESYQCASDVPSLSVCGSLSVTFFNEAQYSWGFGLQNNTGSQIDAWEVQIPNADYQLNVSQLSNQGAFTYSQLDNGDGTFDLTLTGTGPIAPYGGIPGGNIQWSGVNFGFDPTSNGISVFCGSIPFAPPVATDDCSVANISIISDQITTFNSENDFTRVITYMATDSSGNISVPFTKTITVQDTTAPTASNPGAISVYCSADVPVPDTSLVLDEADNCVGPLTVIHVGDSTDGGYNPETITRTYSITDAAGNTTNVFQIISVYQSEILSQPMDVNTAAGTNVVFSVTANNVDQYQWQVSTNGGVSFSNLLNGSGYSGVQTSNLQIQANAVDLQKNGYRYRVLLSNSASSCPAVASLPALLTVGVRSIITNRRITYRVNKN